MLLIHADDLYIIYLEAAMIFFDLMLCVFLFIQKRDTIVNRRFLQMMYVLTIGTLLDVIVGVGLNHPEIFTPFALRVLRATNGVASTVLGYMALRYVLAFVRTKQDPKTDALLIIPLILCVSIWVTNPFTGIIIDYSKGDVVNAPHGALYMLMYYHYPLFYIALSILCLILYRKRFDRLQRNALLCNLVFIVALSVFQMVFFPYLMITYYVASVAAFTMFFALETPAYDRLLRAMDELMTTRTHAETMRDHALNAQYEKTVFLRDMAQEMRTPVNTIVGMEEVIAKDATQNQIRDYARQMLSSSDRLNAIIQGLSEYIRIETDEVQTKDAPYKVATLLDDICKASYESVRKKGLQFHVTVQGAMKQELEGDEQHLVRIMQILVENAAKYTGEGTVSLIVSGEETKEGGITLNLKVTDTGRGIRADDIPKLFVPFAHIRGTTPEEESGAGFGLLIAKAMTEQMGGTITVTSTPLSGSTFLVSVPQKKCTDAVMPYYDPAAVIAHMDKEATGSADGELEKYRGIFSGRKILVVDDTSVVLTIMSGFLKGTGAMVDVARTGEVCLRMAEKTAYDLILMDHLMPDLDGVSAVEAIRRREEDETFASRGVPVVAITGRSGENLKEFYLSKGFEGYLAKPVRLRPLMDMLCDILLK